MPRWRRPTLVPLASMRHLVLVFLLFEIGYVLSVRALLHQRSGGLLELEFYWCLLRVCSLVPLAWIFRELQKSPLATAPHFSPRYLIATGMFLAPLLVGEMGFAPPQQALFAATSVLVGLREELAYRAILQRVLTARFGLGPSLLLSNLAFIAYHYGIQPFTLHYVLQLFLCGGILGLVYHRSGSLVLVATLHTIYDALDAYSPFLQPRLPDFACTIILSSTLAALFLATKRFRRAAPPTLAPQT